MGHGFSRTKMVTLSSRRVLVALFLGVACGRDAHPTELPCHGAPRQLTPASDTVQAGDTVRFRVPPTELAQTTGVQLVWSSSNIAIASVSADSGLARGLAAGVTSIRADDRTVTTSGCALHYWVGTLFVH